jgi:uncharacterized membrane protein
MSLFDDGDAVMILLAILVGGFLLVGVPVMAVIAYRRSNQLRDELIALRLRLEAVEQRQATVGAVSITQTDIHFSTAIDPVQPMPSSPVVEPASAADPMDADRNSEQPQDEPPVPYAAPAAMPLPEARTVMAPERLSLEQLLGARGFVWIGGLSIALAGAFFVKYSLDQGLLSPALRIAIGVLFGLALLVAGEWMRPRSTSIAQALIAAGFADLFASLFAAHALYDLIPAPIDFALLAAVAAAGILAALRHGPFVGIVGMAGGFLTPALVSTGEPRPTALFIFLFLILFGALLLWRRRRWWYVAALGLVGSLGWVWLYTNLNWVEADNWRQGEIQLPLFILTISALMIWTFDGRTSLWGKTGPGATPLSQIERLIDIGGNLIAAGFLGLWLSNGSYNLPDWAALIALMSLHLLAARRYPSREIIGFAAAAFVIVVLATMPLMIRAIGGEVLIDRSYDITALSLTLGVLLVLGGYGLSFGAAKPVHWSGLSVLASAALFAVVYVDFRHQALLISWPLLSVLLAGLHLVFAERLYNKRGSELPYRASFALHCLAVVGFIAAGIPLQVGSGWIAVIWALLLPPVIWIADRLQEIWLRRVIWVAIPGILIALFLSGFPVGDRPILNWLLYGVGIPFLACIASGWLLRRKPSGLPPAEDLSLLLLVDLTAAFLGFLLISLEVRQYFHGHDLIASEFSMTEAATLAILWLAAAKVVVRLALRREEVKLLWAALLLAIIGTAALIIGPILVLNPLFNPIDIGHRPIFNQALYAFILPAIGCLMVARSFDRARGRVGPQDRDLIGNLTAMRMILGATALVAGFIGVSILNRQLFAGNIVVWPAGTFVTDLKSDAELYGYSLAWLGYGALLILLALATKSGPLRHAAAGVILLAVLKVFLIDAAGLTGLFRVASFLGLGVSLIAFGYLYQRFVLIKRA